MKKLFTASLHEPHWQTRAKLNLSPSQTGETLAELHERLVLRKCLARFPGHFTRQNAKRHLSLSGGARSRAKALCRSIHAAEFVGNDPQRRLLGQRELCPSAGGSGPACGEPAPADMDGVANLAPRE
jgi:hypothetical protein